MTDIERLEAEVATLRHDLEVARGLLSRSAKVMREWTGYDTCRTLYYDIDAFITPSAPTTPTVGPPTCQPWCSGPRDLVPLNSVYSFNVGAHVHAADSVFCSPACRKAGRPLNPPLPRTDGPTKGTP